MYAPELRVNSDEIKLSIVDRKLKPYCVKPSGERECSRSPVFFAIVRKSATAKIV
jgi:hypothetical protein